MAWALQTYTSQEKRSSTFRVECLDAQAWGDMTDVGTGSCSSGPSPGAVCTQSRVIPAAGGKSPAWPRARHQSLGLGGTWLAAPDLVFALPKADSPGCPAEVQRLPALNLDGGGEQKVLGDGAQPHPVPGGAVRHLARLGLLTWARQLAGGSGTLDHS